MRISPKECFFMFSTTAGTVAYLKLNYMFFTWLADYDYRCMKKQYPDRPVGFNECYYAFRNYLFSTHKNDALPQSDAPKIKKH
jgi:hypothetical protein